MLKKLITLTLLAAITTALAACAATSPNALTGNHQKEIRNDKNRVVGYQAN